jgi:hypothetical protein
MPPAPAVILLISEAARIKRSCWFAMFFSEGTLSCQSVVIHYSMNAHVIKLKLNNLNNIVWPGRDNSASTERYAIQAHQHFCYKMANIRVVK